MKVAEAACPWVNVPVTHRSALMAPSNRELPDALGGATGRRRVIPKPFVTSWYLLRRLEWAPELPVEVPEPTRSASMSTNDAIVRLIDEIQARKLELDHLRRCGAIAAELEAKERMLERLRWRLAAIARRAARDDLGSAA